MSAAADLARTLCLRDPAKRYRFSFGLASDSDLRIEPIRARAAAAGPAAPGERSDVLTGAVVVEPDYRLVFCAKGDPRRLLSRLADWAKATAPRLPAAAALIDAGAAEFTGDATKDAAIQAIDPAALTVHRDRDLWAGVANADPACVAAALSDCLPGERLWYWLTDAPGAFGLPLLLQSVADDPNRDHLNALIDFVERGAPGRAATGIGYATEGGSLQFIGPDLHPAMLPVLAAWVKDWVDDHPALARLSGCRLLRSVRGKVQDVIEDPAQWDGIARPATPATSAETDQLLASLRPGQECWFWLTGTAPEGVFLTLGAVADDPEGTGFGARMTGLYRRFPASYTDAMIGVVRRQASGALVFVASQPHAEQWPSLRQRLAERHGAAAPALAAAELQTGNAARSPARAG